LPERLCKIAYDPRVAKIVPFSDARAHLTELLDEVEEIHEHVVITRNGRPAAVVMSQPEYESLIETLEVLSDHELMAALEESDEDTAAGRLIPWDEVKRDLGLA
jgi:antitoxin YefM